VIFIVLIFVDPKSGWIETYRMAHISKYNIAQERERERGREGDCEKDIHAENMQRAAVNACASDHTN